MIRHHRFPYPLYLVISETDCKHGSLTEVTEAAIKGGVDILQLREKSATTAEFIQKATTIKQITDHYKIPLIINDNLDVAIAVDAAGIHVGNKDLSPVEIRRRWKSPGKLIGYSIEYLEQLDYEQTREADYLGISPIFNTPTKQDTVTEWGLEGIASIRLITTKPLIAIGSMNLQNAGMVIDAGADSIAVVSAICGAKDPMQAAAALKKEIIG